MACVSLVESPWNETLTLLGRSAVLRHLHELRWKLRPRTVLASRAALMASPFAPQESVRDHSSAPQAQSPDSNKLGVCYGSLGYPA